MSKIIVRKRILEISRKMFFSFGIKKVTVDEIAAELGIGKATLYEHFPSKNLLIQAVLEEKRHEMEKYLRDMQRRIDSDEDLYFIDLTKELITFGSNELGEMKDPFLREINRSLSSFSLEMDFFDLLRPIVDKLLERGIREKMIKDDFNKEVFTEMLFCLVDNIISNHDFSNKIQLPQSEVMDTVVKIIVAGLLTDNGRQEYRASKQEK